MGNILGNRTPNQNGVYILEPDRFTLLQQGLPVDKVRQSRGPCVAAVLIIIQAWRKAGSSRAAVDNIVTYGGAWSDSVPPDVARSSLVGPHSNWTTQWGPTTPDRLCCLSLIQSRQTVVLNEDTLDGYERHRSIIDHPGDRRANCFCPLPCHLFFLRSSFEISPELVSI